MPGVLWSRERDFPAEQLCKCQRIPAMEAAIARGVPAGWRRQCRWGGRLRRCGTDPEGLEPVPSAFSAVLACEKKMRESQSACKELVNTLGADLQKGGVAVGLVFTSAKLGWDETDGGDCCKKAVF